MIEGRSGKLAQLPQINVRFVKGIVARDGSLGFIPE